MRKIILFLLLIASLGVAVYFKGDFIQLYNDVDSQIKNFQKTELGSVVSKVGKKILAPAPLRIGGEESQVVLLKSEIISETNLHRAQNGLPPLKENTLLDNAASAKANDMFQNQYFEHESPTGVDPGTLVSNYRYNYIFAGENLILGNFESEKKLVQDWMDSPGHRENILNNKYTEIGVSIVKGTYNGQTVWIGVQEFGFPLSACQQPNLTLKDKIDLDRTQLDFLLSQIDEKKNEIDNTNRRSSAYNQMVEDYNKLVAKYDSLAEEVKAEVSAYNEQANIFNNCVGGK